MIELARWRGWCCTHFRTAPTRSGSWATPLQGDAGFVDLVLARRGVVLHVELKSQVGRVSPDQRRWAEHLGDSYRLWRPSDMPVIQQELR